MVKGARWFNALGNLCLQKTEFSTLGRPLFAWNDRLPTLWGPRPAFRRSRRRPQAAGIHFRRKAQRASCRSCVRTVCPEQTGGGGTRAAGCKHSPAVADRCFATRNIGEVCRYFQMVKGARWFNALGNLCLQKTEFSTLGRPLFAWNDRLPTLWGPRPAFRRSRRRPQAAGIHFRRKAQRASCRSCARTVYPEQTGGGGTREKCRDCLPKGGRQKKRRRRTQGGTWTCFMASSRTSVVSTVRINEQGMIEHHILSGIVRSQ